MKKRRRKAALCIGICVWTAVSAGCGKTEQKTIGEWGRGCTVGEAGYCVGEDGILVLENGGLAAFYDPETEIYLPLCSKPNCRHETKSCAAVSLADQADWLAYHRGSLYYSSPLGGGGTELYSADINGENVKKIGSYPHRMSWGKRIFYEGKLYLTTNDDIFLENGEFDGVRTELLEIDLASGTEKILAQKSRYIKPGYGLLGINSGKLYYIDYTDKNRLEARDLSSRQSEELREGVLDASLEGDILFYCTENGQAYEKNLKEDTERLIGNGIILPDVWNEQIRIAVCEDQERNGYYKWEEETGLTKIAPFQPEGGFVYQAQLGGYLFGSYEQKFSRIKAEDYLSGTWEAEVLEITAGQSVQILP